MHESLRNCGVIIIVNGKVTHTQALFSMVWTSAGPSTVRSLKFEVGQDKSTSTSTGEVSVSKGGEKWESFKGRGETLSGRKTKGKGISHRGVDRVEGTRVQRTEYVSPLSLSLDITVY